MDKIRIKGKSDLYGSIEICGSKNASLPILASSILSNSDLILKNIPDLVDVQNMQKLLLGYGVKITCSDNQIILNAKNIQNISTDYDVVRKMRASILILGPLLSRFGEAKISLPGGCAIGTRPIDIHLDGLIKLGCDFKIEDGFVIGNVKSSLLGSYVRLPFPSVGATENILMAAVLTKGKTIIDNAAKEPEIIDLVKCLVLMGAKIKGEGTNCLEIEGVEKLKKANHEIISDRIVAGTYIILAVMLNKEVEILNLNTDHNESLIKLLNKMGSKITLKKNSLKIFPTKKISGCEVKTAPYPGFPTDLQAQIMALMCLADGDSQIRETVFENRFMHVSELNRLGAEIKVKKETAYIKGNRKFKGAQVMASDLRASVSLVLAGLCADGETIINRVYHLDRGYEKIEKKLKENGPIIIREKI